MLARTISTVGLGALLVACGSDPVDLDIDDLAGTWAASWGPLSGAAAGNDWTCTQAATTLVIGGAPGGGLEGTVSSLLMHCSGPAELEFDGEFGNSDLTALSLQGNQVQFRLGTGQLGQEGEMTPGSMSGMATWTFTTPAHYVDGVLTTQATIAGPWSANRTDQLSR